VIRGARRRRVLRARLMPHRKLQRASALALQLRQRLRNHGIETRGAKAATDHQQADRRATSGKPQLRQRQRNDLRTYRIADDAGPRARRKSRRERAQHLARQRRQAAIGKPRNGVLLVNHQRAST
jgi:hypothetical protein